MGLFAYLYCVLLLGSFLVFLSSEVYYSYLVDSHTRLEKEYLVQRKMECLAEMEYSGVLKYYVDLIRSVSLFLGNFLIVMDLIHSCYS